MAKRSFDTLYAPVAQWIQQRFSNSRANRSTGVPVPKERADRGKVTAVVVFACARETRNKKVFLSLKGGRVSAVCAVLRRRRGAGPAASGRRSRCFIPTLRSTGSRSTRSDGDTERLLAVVAPDIVIHYGAMPEPLEGRERHTTAGPCGQEARAFTSARRRATIAGAVFTHHVWSRVPELSRHSCDWQLRVIRKGILGEHDPPTTAEAVARRHGRASVPAPTARAS
jgi:hypothetical protein